MDKVKIIKNLRLLAEELRKRDNSGHDPLFSRDATVTLEACASTLRNVMYHQGGNDWSFKHIIEHEVLGVLKSAGDGLRETRKRIAADVNANERLVVTDSAESLAVMTDILKEMNTMANYGELPDPGHLFSTLTNELVTWIRQRAAAMEALNGIRLPSMP